MRVRDRRARACADGVGAVGGVIARHAGGGRGESAGGGGEWGGEGVVTPHTVYTPQLISSLPSMVYLTHYNSNLYYIWPRIVVGLGLMCSKFSWLGRRSRVRSVLCPLKPHMKCPA